MIGGAATAVSTGALTLDRRAAALAAWNQLRGDSLLTLAIIDDHFEIAARFADQHELDLRAGDALHLAIAAGGGHHLVTLDLRLADAAPRLGIPVEAI